MRHLARLTLSAKEEVICKELILYAQFYGIFFFAQRHRLNATLNTDNRTIADKTRDGRHSNGISRHGMQSSSINEPFVMQIVESDRRSVDHCLA